MNANDATCPLCRAKPGQLCTEVSVHGFGRLKQAHAERQHLARLGPCSRCGADVGEPCFQKNKGFLLIEHWSRMECLAVSCDYCIALPGDLCRDSSGHERGPHKCRVEWAKAWSPADA